jgi:four helix bundle protein
MAYHSYEDLDVWKKGTQVAIRIYELLNGCRDYGLKDQMTRAAVSIPSNIAEGAARSSTKEFVRYLNIAKGSAAELNTQIYIAHQVHLINLEEYKELADDLKIISRKAHKLIEYLKGL